MKRLKRLYGWLEFRLGPTYNKYDANYTFDRHGNRHTTPTGYANLERAAEQMEEITIHQLSQTETNSK